MREECKWEIAQILVKALKKGARTTSTYWSRGVVFRVTHIIPEKGMPLKTTNEIRICVNVNEFKINMLSLSVLHLSWCPCFALFYSPHSFHSHRSITTHPLQTSSTLSPSSRPSGFSCSSSVICIPFFFFAQVRRRLWEYIYIYMTWNTNKN